MGVWMKDVPLKRGSDLCSQTEKLYDSHPEQKVKPHPALVFNHRPYPDLKEESLFHPSYLLYMCDRVGVPVQSQAPPPGKEEAGLGVEVLGALLRQGCGGGGKRRATPVTPAALSEEDKDRMVLELLRVYCRQQEALRSALQRHRQLEMELEALQGEERTEHAQTQGEDHTEHAQTQGEDHTEHAQTEGEQRTEHAQTQDQRELEDGLEKPRQKTCTCKTSAEQRQEAQYTSQLQELRRRLDRAEEDREELQEELQAGPGRGGQGGAAGGAGELVIAGAPSSSRCPAARGVAPPPRSPPTRLARPRPRQGRQPTPRAVCKYASQETFFSTF
ncbi:hypothetical protein MATL_G00022520 [Megalops atlanticus]|uniref:Uncharacterized protein n=1 Tax=Megalops atlanticus TaxID=7932 RepID=A0A9D3TC92_MEGAT|nr:hypothetical protein MATL_G00022520 [Megalops atlanticus]